MNNFSEKEFEDTKVTPVMSQYLAIKREHTDCLLFYRMGDFYEMFFEDAVQAAEALEIVLTQRGKYQGKNVPMCGVPVRNHEFHLARLVRKGFRVAICEQFSKLVEPRKRGTKEVLKREVVRIVTAGTLTEDELLNARDSNYLAALAESQGTFGIAWVDVSTSAFGVQAPAFPDLGAALARLAPREILISVDLIQRADLNLLLSEWKSVLHPQHASCFDGANARKRLETLYRVKTLEGFGAFAPAEITAAGVLIDYIALTQKGCLPHLPPPRQLCTDTIMMIDRATRRNLEILTSQSKSERSSLRAAIDCTVTSGGARLLAEHLAAPLTDPCAIVERLDAVQFFKDRNKILISVREKLCLCPDLERALSRLTIGRGGPRDLATVRDALEEGQNIHLFIVQQKKIPKILYDAINALCKHNILIDKLKKAIVSTVSFKIRDENFIADFYNQHLDELRLLKKNSERLITALQTSYIKSTGIPTLKIAHNNVLGFYVEVSARQAEKLKAHSSTFKRRQETITAVRFTTTELAALEEQRRDATERILSLEEELIQDLICEITDNSNSISAAARAIAVVDVASALAKLATERHYCRPLVDDSTLFKINSGRHPVVEVTMNHETPFVSNHCQLDSVQPIWLLTGANMAGKSTFLRQNALIALLAQIGSFVPAESAHIGVIDRLFSRIGAADDLAHGRSTFMVEMIETASILHQSTRRSLVILDEIGRGTAILDGLAIAWAGIEHLHNNVHCRCLFSTHYHELATLAHQLPGLACYTMRIKEWHGQIVFLYEVIEGTANLSAGLHTAKLAGLPESVLARAAEVLVLLEKSGPQRTVTQRVYTTTAPPVERATPIFSKPSTVEKILLKINIDKLTPLQAIQVLYALKEKCIKHEL